MKKCSTISITVIIIILTHVVLRIILYIGKSFFYYERKIAESLKCAKDLNSSDLILTVRISSLCKDERTDFM